MKLENRESNAADEVEVTPEMIEAGKAALDQWLLRWDYLADGVPGDDDLSACVSRIFTAMFLSKPVLSRNLEKSL